MKKLTLTLMALLLIVGCVTTTTTNPLDGSVTTVKSIDPRVIEATKFLARGREYEKEMDAARSDEDKAAIKEKIERLGLAALSGNTLAEFDAAEVIRAQAEYDALPWYSKAWKGMTE